MTILQYIGQGIATAGIVIASLFGYHQTAVQQQYGTTVNQTPALFETSLASAISPTATSMSLLSGTLNDGTELNGNYCFTLDSGTTVTEYVCGTASDTAVTNLQRGIGSDGLTSYPALAYNHRYGADVKITDFPQLQQLTSFISGNSQFPNILYYVSSTATSSFNNAYQIASVGYVNSVAISGAPNGSTSTKGIYQEATSGQLISGTNIGSTGADLIVPNYLFNQTPTSSSIVPVTNSTGTLNSNFISQSSNYAWTGTSSFGGTSTFNGAVILNATSTFNGASTYNVSPFGITNIFGTGADGASTTATSSTTTLARDYFFTNYTVPTTSVVITNGYRIFISNLLTVSGTIEFNGVNGGAGSGVTGGTGGTALATGTVFGSFAGGNGGTGNVSGGVTGSSTLALVYSATSTSGAGGGGGGGSSTPGVAGSAGTVTQVTSLSSAFLNVSPYIAGNYIQGISSGAGGGGGGGGSGSSGSPLAGGGGGGGSSGGFIDIAARTVVINAGGVIEAIGGNGGTGAAANLNGGSVTGSLGGGGGGGGGSGGIISIIYTTLTNNGSMSVSGGSAGLPGANNPSGTAATGTPGRAGIISEIQF